MMYNVVDLFCGAGGLSLGFTQTGRVNIVAAAENNPNARKTYKRNFKVERVYTDVRDIDYSELLDAVDHVDIVIGGPPCQGFSNANRQHTTIISMNNRLVKEYVRAICALKPRAFVMENVASLKSQIHRFMVDEGDLEDARIMGMNLSNDEVEILPAKSSFEGALGIIQGNATNTTYVWAESFFKEINLLYRFRINQPKFDSSLEKYKNRLQLQLKTIIEEVNEAEQKTAIQDSDLFMAKAIIAYMEQKTGFDHVIRAIEKSLLIQRALLRIKELKENNIHVFEYRESNGAIIAAVKSYAVRDYIKTILEGAPFNYKLSENTLNALNYGAPQRRERFIIVGLSKELDMDYSAPEAQFDEANCRTVRDAIADIQDIEPALTVDSKFIELKPHFNGTSLEKELRGKLLYNHVTTDTRETALSRFKALKEGQNFHDLDPGLKTTYSNAERTQNTIYMRLKYDEPCGTVVNVRKSMWIHPVLDRAISIREAARLQTFPDSFIFEGTKDSQYQQIGNAVPPFLSRAIAKSVISILDNAE